MLGGLGPGLAAAPAVVAQMKQMPVEGFWSDRVPVPADGQSRRPMSMMRVKWPAESRSADHGFAITGDIAPAEARRRLSQSACLFIRSRG